MVGEYGEVGEEKRHRFNVAPSNPQPAKKSFRNPLVRASMVHVPGRPGTEINCLFTVDEL